MKKLPPNRIFPTVLALLLASSLSARADLALEETGAYAAGTRALNEQRWADAVASFEAVVKSKARKADGALYWKAYALNKLGRAPLALATCMQLQTTYAESSWNRDCSALTMNLRGGERRSTNVGVEMGRTAESEGRGSNADLKMLALNSLINRDPAQAVPLLRGMLTGDQPQGIKEHAIFVLAQSRSPEAEDLLHDLMTGKVNPAMQRKTIQMVGVFQGKRANDSLAEIYRTTTDREVKKAVISAFFISQDASRMVDLARNEKDLELKRSIVSQLALMQDKAATDYMLELLK